MLILLVVAASAHGQEAWPQFRGPGGSGVAGGAATLPSVFGQDTNRRWTCETPHGISSPVVWGERIFLTGSSGSTLETFAVDRPTGKILWRRPATYEFIERFHRSNSPATPTPVTDGERVCVYFGSSGLICYDFDGNEVWSRFVRIPPNLYGTASSLILAGGRLIFCNDTDKESFLEAIDPETGSTIWKTKREGLRYNWTTPLYFRNGDTDEVVVNGQAFMKAYSLADGSERWSLPGLTDEPIITPVRGPEGMLFVSSYNMKTNTEVIGPPTWGELLKELDTDRSGTISFTESRANTSVLSRADADGEGDHPLWGFHPRLDRDGNGELDEKEWQALVAWIDSFPQENAVLAVRPGTAPGALPEIAWKYGKGVPECPSPLYLGGRLYLVKNGGMITCLDAASGELVYQDRLGAGGPYYASPVAGDGKVYLASVRGVVTVIAAGPRLEVLGRNDLGERIAATPALVDGDIVVRTDTHLHCFSEPRSEAQGAPHDQESRSP